MAQNVVWTVSAETCDGAREAGRTLGEAAGAPLEVTEEPDDAEFPLLPAAGLPLLEVGALLAAEAPFVGEAWFACVTLLFDTWVGVGGAPSCARAAPGSNMASNSSSARRAIAPSLTTSIA